jgi:UDP-N-acetylglucosamine 2-epimerase (non-hydrolysing)
VNSCGLINADGQRIVWVMIVAGARPNFMKIAPLMKEIAKYPESLQPILVHTG